MIMRRTPLSDRLSGDAWQRLRAEQVSGAGGWPDANQAVALSDDMPVDEWQMARDRQVRLIPVPVAREGDAVLRNLPARPTDPPARLVELAAAQTPRSAGQWEVDEAQSGGQPLREAGKAAGRALDSAIYRVVGQGPEGHRSSNPVANWGENHVGRGGYAAMDPALDARGLHMDQLPESLRGRGALKCNQFVWDALAAGGAPAGKVGDRIPVARDWGDPNSKIPNYAPVTGSPQPGDVVSNGHHVGIFAPLPNGKPATISAASWGTPDGGMDGGVVHNTWGFRGTEGKVTVWRRTSRPQALKAI